MSKEMLEADLGPYLLDNSGQYFCRECNRAVAGRRYLVLGFTLCTHCGEHCVYQPAPLPGLGNA